MSLVSYEEENNETENNADNQAYNWMVNEQYYKHICSDSNYKIESEKEYPKSFIVYRLARDNYIQYNSKEYQLYNNLIKK